MTWLFCERSKVAPLATETELAVAAEKARAALIEELSEHDEAVLAAYLESPDVPADILRAGVRRATGEWVAFMDCGQNFPLDWLEKQFAFAQRAEGNGTGGVCTFL